MDSGSGSGSGSDSDSKLVVAETQFETAKLIDNSLNLQRLVLL